MNKRVHVKQKLVDNAKAEKKDTIEILKNKGFDLKQAQALTNIYVHNEEYWLDFLMQNKYKISDSRGENEIFTSLSTFFLLWCLVLYRCCLF